MRHIGRSLGALCALSFASFASAAQMVGLAGPNLLPFQPSWSQTFGAAVPSAAAGSFQTGYPYVGQCIADGANQAAFPGLPLCAGGSFAPVGTNACNQTVGPWLDCAAGANKSFVPVTPALPPTLAAAAVAAGGYGTNVNVKYQWEVLNPPDYTPDKVTYTGADYYELGVHEAMGFQTLANLNAFPNPLAPAATSAATACTGAACPPHPYAAGVPDGQQWTGLRCNNPAGCTCRSDFSAVYCPAGRIPFGAPLYTQVWGIGQINMGGTLGVALPPNPTPWSQNGYVATWPSISIRGTRGKPVVVKWTNEFPNNHVFCPHPEAADWPCAIDRTFMGVRDVIDPALAPSQVPWHGVNAFGSPQQPDNSWVTHLHGAETPPSTDGFAEKWFGNAVTSARYTNTFVNPPFENPSSISLRRPASNADTYTYPMVQEEMLIWFHDHTLGKTHHNVVAGPAGFFPVKDPARHGPMANGVCTPGAGQTDCAYTWLDPLTEQRGALNIPTNDLFFAIQDRSFSEDGSINFSNGLGQPIPAATPVMGPNPGVNANGTVTPLACFAAGTCVAQGTTPVTPGVNPQVHPVWVPEYFGDHALVNGVLWPKKQVGPGWYRVRLVDGSDSRCWTIGLSTTQPVAGKNPTNNVPFYVLANDQGYLAKPVLAAGNTVTMCPGERYELLVNFGALPTNLVGGVRVPATNVWMTNTAPAPFPAGITPQMAASPFVDLDTLMRFDLVTTAAAVKTCAGSTVTAPFGGFSWPLAAGAPATAACIPNPANVPVDASFTTLEAQLRPPAGTTGLALQNWVPPGGVVRMVYLNERLDGLTGQPMGMQLNGVPFEYKVTETPKDKTIEVWKFVNLTVDAHPMHPHLVKHLVVSRQNFSVANYKKALCGSTTCMPGTTPGGEMVVVPDVTPFLSNATGGLVAVTSASNDGGFKDAVIARPGQVTTIAAKWEARWTPSATPTAPGTAGAAPCQPNPALGTVCGAAPFTYEPVTSGPYVWHCHINSHEDSEMMRTSLVVP